MHMITVLQSINYATEKKTLMTDIGLIQLYIHYILLSKGLQLCYVISSVNKLTILSKKITSAATSYVLKY